MTRKAGLEADNATYAASFKDGHKPGPPAKQLVRGRRADLRHARLPCASSGVLTSHRSISLLASRHDMQSRLAWNDVLGRWPSQ